MEMIYGKRSFVLLHWDLSKFLEHRIRAGWSDERGTGNIARVRIGFSKSFLEGDERRKPLLLQNPSNGTMTTNIHNCSFPSKERFDLSTVISDLAVDGSAVFY
jgi:hypothetical protein